MEEERRRKRTISTRNRPAVLEPRQCHRNNNHKRGGGVEGEGERERERCTYPGHQVRGVRLMSRESQDPGEDDESNEPRRHRQRHRHILTWSTKQYFSLLYCLETTAHTEWWTSHLDLLCAVYGGVSHQVQFHQFVTGRLKWKMTVDDRLAPQKGLNHCSESAAKHVLTHSPNCSSIFNWAAF